MEGLPISEQLSTPSVVTQIIAGTNITIDQPNGNVTINAPGAGPGGGVLTIAGLEGVVTLSSPGGAIGITVNDQDIELTNTGVVSVTGGNGISVNTASGVATIDSDGVLSISDGTNAPSIGAIVLSSGDGITVEDTAGTFAITNTGVTQLTGGDGIGIDTSTGSVTVSNLGLLSASAGSGIGAVTAAGVLTIDNKGVRTLADLSGAVVLSPGTGIGVVTSIETNTITLSNIGITSVSAGTAMGVSTASGVATVTNNGVRTFFDLSGAITVSATGATISKAGQNIDWTVNFPVDSVNAQTGAILIEAGDGITVTNSETPSIQIANDGVLSVVAGAGISLSGDTPQNPTINYVAAPPVIQAAGTTALTPVNNNTIYILTSGTVQNFTTAGLGAGDAGKVWYVKNAFSADIDIEAGGVAIAGQTDTIHQGTGSANSSIQVLYWSGTVLTMY